MPTLTPEENADAWYLDQLKHEEIFKEGQKDVLDKLIAISKPWVQGKITDEEYARKLNKLIEGYKK